jgi:hypothetical protein
LFLRVVLLFLAQRGVDAALRDGPRLPGQIADRLVQG